jgi:C-terminal processing protease CtpA/Prc
LLHILCSFAHNNHTIPISQLAHSLQMDEKKGYCKVTDVTPGSVSAIDGMILAGDIVVEVNGKSMTGLSYEAAMENLAVAVMEIVVESVSMLL